MTGNLQAIGFLFTWVLLWCLGGIAIEALLLQAGLIAPGAAAAGGLGFLLWTVVIGFAGWALFNRITGLTQPAPPSQPRHGVRSQQRCSRYWLDGAIGEPAASFSVGAQPAG